MSIPAAKGKYTRRGKTPPLSDLLRTPAAVEYAQTSRSALYRWGDAGLIRRYRVGAATYWSKTELDQMVTVYKVDGVA